MKILLQLLLYNTSVVFKLNNAPVTDIKTFYNLQDDLTKLSEIENSLAIFCMATYGEGDPTDNAQELYDWLQEGTEELPGLKYAVSLCICLF